MAMGMADLIPGVSGGTIAFISGIYHQLLGALSAINSKTLVQFFTFRLDSSTKGHFSFLVTLGLGLATSVILFSRLVHYLLVDYAVLTWSFFFGLIAASIVLLIKDTAIPVTPSKISFFLFGIVAGFLVTRLVPVETPETLWFIALSGFIAITAMILPGISGSFLLLILGKYELIISALGDPLNTNHLIILATFGLGCVTGLLSVSRLLSSLFRKYPQIMVSFLTGLLMGSLGKIWPWKEVVTTVTVGGKERVVETQNVIPPFSPQVTYALLWAVIGIVTIFLLDYLHTQSKNKRGVGVTG